MTSSACMPFCPCTATKVTFWPSRRLLKPLPWIALKCTKRSGPLSGVMKPNPFSSLNHFTVPDWRSDITAPLNHVLRSGAQDARLADQPRWGNEGQETEASCLRRDCGDGLALLLVLLLVVLVVAAGWDESGFEEIRSGKG